jgi:hypothetical protein
VLRAMRTKIKQTFHPPVSQMKYQALIEYVWWTAHSLKWTWTELGGLKIKSRQPPGCRISARPGKLRVPPGNAVGQIVKREPSQYNVFIQSYIKENKRDDSDIRQLFKEAAVAWKNRDTPEQGDEEPDEIEPEVEFEPPDVELNVPGPPRTAQRPAGVAETPARALFRGVQFGTPYITPRKTPRARSGSAYADDSIFGGPAPQTPPRSAPKQKKKKTAKSPQLIQHYRVDDKKIAANRKAKEKRLKDKADARDRLKRGAYKGINGPFLRFWDQMTVQKFKRPTRMEALVEYQRMKVLQAQADERRRQERLDREYEQEYFAEQARERARKSMEWQRSQPKIQKKKR